jgi:hypothetical protein
MKNFLFLFGFLFVFFGFAQLDTAKISSLRKQTETLNAQADSLKKISDSLSKEIIALQKKHPDSLLHWKKGAAFNVNATQVSLTNWVGGGQNSVSLGGIVNLFANYKNGKASWDNSLLAQYGIFRQGTNVNWWKNDDQSQLTSKYGYQAFDHWNYTALFDFKTQFSPGFNYPNDSVIISDILSPGYGILALGLDWKPKSWFTFLVAPATGKFTIVNNQRLADEGAFGVDKAITDTAGNIIAHGKKFRAEIGGYIKMQFKKEIVKNVNLESNLELFSNYLEHPENIDVNWTTLTTFKINKLLTATLSTHLIYDNDVQVPVDRDGDDVKESTGPRVQFKQLFGLGFTYKI